MNQFLHVAILALFDVHVLEFVFLCCAGYGRCWWSQPGAAELPSQGAQALRQDSCRSLQMRWLMPQAMLELITYEPDSGQVDSATPDPDAKSAQPHTNGKEQQAGGLHCHCWQHGKLHTLSEHCQLQLTNRLVSTHAHDSCPVCTVYRRTPPAMHSPLACM